MEQIFQIKTLGQANPAKKQLSVVIPVFNEETSIKQTIQELKQELDRIPDLEFEIIAVNDASMDKSREAINELADIRILDHHKNQGYGASLKSGIKEARYDWIFIIDADQTYPVKEINELLKHIPKYDMVIGARKKYRPALGRPAKWYWNKFASYLTGYKVIDLNSGMRIFKKEIALNFWGLFPERFSFTSTLTMVSLSNGYEVKNIKIDYLKRNGKSKLKPLKSLKQFLSLIARLALYFRPLKVFGPLALLLFLTAIIVLIYSFFFAPKILDTTIALLAISAIQCISIGMLAELMVKTCKK